MAISRNGRIGDSQAELRRVEAHFDQWLARRRHEDRERQQFHTQLAALETLIDAATTALSGQLGELGRGGGDDGELYDACRLFDLRVLWLERVWHFFRDKFDQRDDPQLAPALQAADDVVWSCYHQPFAQAELYSAAAAAQGPAPLPYIEPRYSPEAFPVELVPRDLRSEVELGFLREHLEALPIPVVRLPPACVQAPWWLILLAHEVGHHVQYDLLEQIDLVPRFREKLNGLGGERWGGWSREIFADAFSVAAAGPWALWAMVELELRAPVAMGKRREAYPAPAVRLALMAAELRGLGIDPGEALHGLDPLALVDDPNAVSEDAGLVDDVATAALEALPGLDTDLATLCDFRPDDFQDGGIVEDLAGALERGDLAPAENSVRGARLAVSAAAAAWSRTGNDRPTLAGRTFALVEASREEGTRAGPPPGPDAADAGAAFAAALVAAEPEQLET